MNTGATPAFDDARAIRSAGAELLSLALIDARNHTLRWLAAFEAQDALLHGDADGAAPLRLAARAGAYQDRWIARNVQRQRGEACSVLPGLAPAEPHIERWLAEGGPAPTADELRGYLARTLETTLDLLPSRGDAAALHFFGLALRHEDRLGEAWAERAAELQLRAIAAAATPPALAQREPLWVPAQRFELGSPAGSGAPENEVAAQEVAVPEFEIDAQPVSWARYVEFAEDGGYDRREWWSDVGWDWAQCTGRRAPRHVEQLRGGVLLQRHGSLQRAAPAQSALHVSRHEAEAWCAWAGRRLPLEPEWELSAMTGASRGFVWGDVFEWVAGSARAWPGYRALAGGLDPIPAAGSVGVLRGASWLTRRRAAHPKARRFAPPAQDSMFCGFRSCAR